MNVVGKFTVDVVTRRYGMEGIQVELRAVKDSTVPEDKLYHKYTPSGEIKMHIDNPHVEGVFTEALRSRQALYVTFSPESPI